MKNLKKLIIGSFLMTIFGIHAQEVPATTPQVEFETGDNITIQKPIGETYLFIHPKSDDKKKAKKGSKLLGTIGRGISAIGIGGSSMEVLSTGTQISNTAGILDTAIDVGDLIKKDMDDMEVELEEVYTVNLDGIPTLLGEFKVKKKYYIVQLVNAYYSNEISVE